MRNGVYRGRMVLSRDGGAVLAVNHVSLEHYLYGVVPRRDAGELAGRGAQGAGRRRPLLRAHAAAARRAVRRVRRRALAGLPRRASPRSPPSTAAVRATRGRVVTVGGEVAQTFFFSTSGGRTAANEEGFGGTPISYLRSVDDPHDDLSPVHTWTARFARARGAAPAARGLTGRLRGWRSRRARRRGGPRRCGARQRRQPRGDVHSAAPAATDPAAGLELPQHGGSPSRSRAGASRRRGVLAGAGLARPRDPAEAHALAPHGSPWPNSTTPASIGSIRSSEASAWALETVKAAGMTCGPAPARQRVVGAHHVAHEQRAALGQVEGHAAVRVPRRVHHPRAPGHVEHVAVAERAHLRHLLCGRPPRAPVASSFQNARLRR